MVLWETCLNSCFISNSGNIVLSFKIFNFFVYLLITSNSSNWIIFLVSSDRAYKGNIHWSHMTNVPHRIWKHNSSVLLLFFFFFSELAWLQCFVFPHKCLLSGRSLLFQWGLEDQKKKRLYVCGICFHLTILDWAFCSCTLSGQGERILTQLLLWSVALDYPSWWKWSDQIMKPWLTVLTEVPISWCILEFPKPLSMMIRQVWGRRQNTCWGSGWTSTIRLQRAATVPKRSLRLLDR